MSDGLWEYAPIILGAPLYVGVGVLIVRTVRDWGGIMARWNERRRDAATEKAGDWRRIRADRDRYHELLKICERERVEWMRRAIAAEAYRLGQGEADQKAQRIVSADRVNEAKKKGKPNG